MRIRKIFFLFLFPIIWISCNTSSGQPQVDDKNDIYDSISKNKIASQDSLPQKIGLLPFIGIDSNYSHLAAKELEAFYYCEVEILKSEKLPSNAFYQPRNRYKADSLIDWLALQYPGKYDKIVGITDKDISTTKDSYDDWGIMGLGFCPGRSCVISTFRLKKNANQEKINERFAKVVLHETGHTFGLPHCNMGDTTCFMEDASGTIKTVDREQKKLCTACQSKIKMYLR